MIKVYRNLDFIDDVTEFQYYLEYSNEYKSYLEFDDFSVFNSYDLIYRVKNREVLDLYSVSLEVELLCEFKQPDDLMNIFNDYPELFI